MSYANLRGRIQKFGAFYVARLLIRELMMRPEFYDIRKHVHFHEVGTSSLLLA